MLLCVYALLLVVASVLVTYLVCKTKPKSLSDVWLRPEPGKHYQVLTLHEGRFSNHFLIVMVPLDVPMEDALPQMYKLDRPFKLDPKKQDNPYYAYVTAVRSVSGEYGVEIQRQTEKLVLIEAG